MAIVSDLDSDDEDIPENERYYFFRVHNNRAVSRVSRNIPLRKVTFAHVRQGFNICEIRGEYRFCLSSLCDIVINPIQESWEIVRYCSEGEGTKENPYWTYICTDW